MLKKLLGLLVRITGFLECVLALIGLVTASFIITQQISRSNFISSITLFGASAFWWAVVLAKGFDNLFKKGPNTCLQVMGACAKVVTASALIGWGMQAPNSEVLQYVLQQLGIKFFLGIMLGCSSLLLSGVVELLCYGIYRSILYFQNRS